MKKLCTSTIVCSFLLFLGGKMFSQNIAVNTGGIAAVATNMFEVTQSSTAANMVALYAIHNGATGAGLTGYGLQAIKTGATGNNVAGYFSASGGANNYAIIVPSGGGKVGIGTSTPSYLLETIGDIYANGGWVRVSGNQGIYWESWGGGFYMSDVTWLRTYNSKNIWTNTGLLGTDGGVTSGYGGTTPPVGGGIFSGRVGVGTNAPSYLVHATTGLAAGTVGAFINTNSTGTGIAAAGQGATINIPANGMGGAFTGLTAGVTGYALTGANPTGVLGSGNNLLGGFTMAGGCGGAFTGTTYAFEGRTTGGTPGCIAGVFYLGGTANYCYASSNNGGTFYGIISNGPKSTVIKDRNDKERVMYCTESPEILFEDYGEGKLINGKAHIMIDSLFASSITINEKHPLRVFVQLKGDCNGVYVTNESTQGFDVVELNGGTSSISFSYHVIGNRKDEHKANGDLLWKYADNRYPFLENVAAKKGDVFVPALPQK